jgi:prepilin-type N-terminal cleavage/methylation domain-containing protein
VSFEALSLNRKAQKNHSSDCGFTLVELIVSISIAGVLMVGLSTFFASTFHNMFQAQEDNSNIERQFAVNQIVADKMGTAESLVNLDTVSDPKSVLTFNRNTKGQLPFSLMTTVEVCPNAENQTLPCSVTKEKRLAFKDLLPFNKIIWDSNGSRYLYGDSGTGWIKNASNATGEKSLGINNFAGFDKDSDGNIYVADPNTDSIFKCGPTTSCEALDFSAIGGLRSPMDVEVGKNSFGDDALFVSDSENGRIVQFNLSGTSPGAVVQPLATNLLFPTGLAYYEKTIGANTYSYLFVADTFNHQIRRINLTGVGTIPIVVGNGNDTTCNGTAKFCKLNLPTGLFADSVNNALYIADSGNNRILKMSDPGSPESLKMKFELSDNYALDRIELRADDWSDGNFNATEGNLTGSANHYSAISKTFSNPDRYTVFSASTGDPCESKDDTLYLNEDLSMSNYLKNGQYLKMGATILKIIETPTAPMPGNCTVTVTPPAFPVELTKWSIKVYGDLSVATSGMVIYPSNPKGTGTDSAVIQIDGLATKWAKAGFLTTEIKTYDIAKGLVETDYQTIQVGDGLLGTEEDSIQVIAETNSIKVPPKPISGRALSFPTGVSDNYFANTIGKNIIVRNTGNDLTAVLDPVKTTDFTPAEFDYISDFPLSSIDFNQLNGNKILETIITTAPDSNGVSQTYTHNAILK